MLVSIIIPAYNAERFLTMTVESVLAQSMTDWELIVIDDGSKDRTGEISLAFAAKDTRIKFVQQQNAGQDNARNTGFNHSNSGSRFVMFLDHDDILEPEALNELVNALEQNPDCVAAHGQVRCIDSKGDPIVEERLLEKPHRYTVKENKLVLEPVAERTAFRHFVVQNVLVTPGQVLIRRDAYAPTGGFDKSISLCSDWDMWVRLSEHGDFVRLGRVTLAYRLHSSNQSRQIALTRQHELGCVRKTYMRAKGNPELQKMIITCYRKHHQGHFRSKIDYAYGELRRGHLVSALRQCAYGAKHLGESFRSL